MSNIPLSIRASRVIRTMISVALAMLIVLSVIPRFQVFAVSVSDKETLVSKLSSNANIELTADIDASGWTTVAKYTGTLNGNGHKIYNLSTGLFNKLTGTVKNVGLLTADNGASTAGVLATSFSGDGTVQGVYVYGTVIASEDTAGSLIGVVEGGTVTQCFSCVSMSGSASSYAGGLIGLIKSGTVSSCYSSGDMTMSSATVKAAGFANKTDGTVTNTYTSMQMIHRNPFSKPSGVDGLYDAQLGILRESTTNKGLSTLDLMKTTALSDAFAVTTTAYPALKCFENNIWDEETANIVDVSTAAAVFSDVEGVTRYEPAGVGPRADYLTAKTYIDRTNIKSLTWSVDSLFCKVYDTVPLTEAQSLYLTGTSADLLRSRLEFSETTTAWMTATSGDKVRKWYLNVNTTKNPYFASGNGSSDSDFAVSTADELNNVRYYSLLSSCYYKQTDNIENIGSLVSIADFSGTYNGDGYMLDGFKILYNTQKYLGVFGSTQSGAIINSLTLNNVTVTAGRDNYYIGLLVGYAGPSTTVSDILIKGTNNVISSTGDGTKVGSLIGGSEKDLKITNALVSVKLTGVCTGGLVGLTKGATIKTSGVTGLVTGSQYIGGLIGQTAGTSTVDHCYSTATVIGDDTTVTSYAGGLVGDATSCTLSNSYCAGLTDAPSFNNAAPLVGNAGTVNPTVFCDMLYDASGLPTATLMNKNFSTTYWVTSPGAYPQINTFTTTTRFQNLSKVSTVPVYHQLYWPNITGGDATTGWIDDDLLNSPTVLTDYSDSGTAKVYSVNSGYGFQPAASQRRVVLKSVNKDNEGIRVFGVTSPNLIPLSYTTSGTTNSSVHVELYYSTNKSDWTAFHVVSNGVTSQEVYSIPTGSYVKAVVRTKDDYEVSSVSFVSNDATTKMTSAQNGAYISTTTFSNAVAVYIVLSTTSPDWGLRREMF